MLQQAPRPQPTRRRNGGGRADDPDQAGQEGAGGQAKARSEANYPPSYPPDSRPPSEAPRPNGGKHLPGPSTSWGKELPWDSGSAKAQLIQGTERSGARPARGRSVPGLEPADKGRHHAPSQHEEAQAETQGPVCLHNPTDSEGPAGSIRTEPQGNDPGATKRVEYTQRPIDGSITEFNSGAHDPIRPFVDAEVEQIALALHQLQFEVQRLTGLHNNRQGGTGVIQSRLNFPGQEQEALMEVEQGETGTSPKEDWKQKMGTEEGAKELRATAEEKARQCPVCRKKHEYQRRLPWGSL